MLDSNNFSRSLFNKTFPFFFTVDYQLVIRDAGKSLLKVRADLIQKSLKEVFEVVRPGVFELNYKSLCKSEGKVFLLSFKHLNNEVLFKAQVIVLEKERRVLFVGSPFVRELEELQRLNLNLNHFSISDSTVDMLQLLQVNKMVNDDMKELNRRLKIKEEKYRSLIEEAKEIIFTTDLNGNFTYMNEVGIKALCLDEEKLLSSNFSELMASKYSENIKAKGLDLLNKKIEVSYVEFPIITFDNLWIGQNMTLVKIDEKRYGFQGIARDITEKITYEKVILGEKEKAQSATKEKSRFLANMSHEIRTPLNGIMGLTNLLLDSEINEKQKKYLSAITSSSETLMVVINDILDISKIEAGKLKISKHMFNIKTCITQLMEMLSAKALEKGVQLFYKEEGLIPEFLIGDEPRLNQILYNVVGNALKFTENGTVEITILHEVISDDLIKIKISVKDSGIGISPEKLKHIFKAFGQVDENDNRKFQGTGLGLTIATKLVDLHGGKIEVESEVGVGSIFSICLPYQVSNGDKSIVQRVENDINSDGLKGVKVLLAEDNPVNQMVTVDLLSNKGAEVDLAENGKVALEKLVLGAYDVVLMDMQMPIMDGYSAMREIRLDSKYKDLPILALTAHVSAQEESNCINNGANDYLSKPFKPSELFAKIQLLVPKKDQSETVESNINSNQEITMNKDNLSDNVCDFAMLYEFTNNNKSIVESTLKLLTTILPKDIKELGQHLSLRDFKRIKAIAHRSKPNFKLIFTEEYASVIVSIEQLAEDSENYNQIAKIISDLEQKESYILSAIDHELSLL